MKMLRLFLLSGVIALLFAQCTVSSHSMKSPNNYIEFNKGDFEYSDQVSGEATEVKILGIDWARLFDKKMGEVSDVTGFEIPIIGSFLAKKVNMYAIYNMIKDNPGYDIVLYPQFETEVNNQIIMKTTRVKVTARLGKLKK
ncbi:MAG TPA: hypothetical protein PLC81_07880 [Bacteroidales bacterium]|nr:hypothetical protein [Bacteroidales bacterium]HQK37539.1 hypothetical protein [Bacteroidales bacterium]